MTYSMFGQEKIRKIAAVNAEIESLLSKYSSTSDKSQAESEREIIGKKNIYPSASAIAKVKVPHLVEAGGNRCENKNSTRSPDFQGNDALAFNDNTSIMDEKRDLNTYEAVKNARLEYTENLEALPVHIYEDNCILPAAPSTITRSHDPSSFGDLQGENVAAQPPSQDLNWARSPNTRLGAGVRPIEGTPPDEQDERNFPGEWVSRQNSEIEHFESQFRQNYQNERQWKILSFTSSSTATDLTGKGSQRVENGSLLKFNSTARESEVWNDVHYFEEAFNENESITSKSTDGFQISQRIGLSRVFPPGMLKKDSKTSAVSDFSIGSETKELTREAELQKHHDERATELDTKIEGHSQLQFNLRRGSASGKSPRAESILRKVIRAQPVIGQNLPGSKVEQRPVLNMIRKKSLKSPMEVDKRDKSPTYPHFHEIDQKLSPRKLGVGTAIEGRRQSELHEFEKSSIAIDDLHELDTSELILLQVFLPVANYCSQCIMLKI